MNLRQVETMLVEHLRESGEIRSDLRAVKDSLKSLKDVASDTQWLKTAFWALVGAGLSLNVAMFGYLLWGRH